MISFPLYCQRVPRGDVIRLPIFDTYPLYPLLLSVGSILDDKKLVHTPIAIAMVTRQPNK